MATQRWGQTDPLSTALPTDSELQANNLLIEELKRNNQYESATDTQKRMNVLNSLQSITEDFVKHVSSKQRKYDDKVLNALGGKVFTYGGFKFGVYGPGSDIDTLVVVPKNISREDFFKYYPEILLKRAPKGSVVDLTSVSDAIVPIITFDYHGISIDLNFCSINQNTVPADLDVRNDNILRGMDDTDARAINGTRVAEELLNLVPQMAIFRTALKGIKLWAKRRALYANIIGFPGGVAWAILVARICQLYPKATSSTIILKFFRIVEKWRWPMPVMLKDIDHGDLGLNIWNPQRNKHDSFHIMPVITPAYPAMCSTHNICRSNMQVLARELKRAGDITDKILMQKAPWKDLYVKHTFFTHDFKYYIAVVSASTTSEAQLKWKGRVQSRIRRLVQGLEGHASISLARPYTEGFERIHKCKSDTEIEETKNGSLNYQIKEVPTATTDLTHEPNVGANKQDSIEGVDKIADAEKVTMVYTTTYYIGLEMKDGAKSLDLSKPVQMFKDLCVAWDKHDSELNALNVTTTRNFELPNDLFSEGEIKPSRPVKKKANGIKKRSATDEPTHPAKKTTLAAAV